MPKVRLYKDAKRRVRLLTPAEVQRRLAELSPHQRDLVLFALSTGLRRFNVEIARRADVNMHTL